MSHEFQEFIVETSPHIKTKSSTRSIMWAVILALLPATIWGLYMFGLPSFYVLLCSIVSAVIFEGVMAKVMKREVRRTLRDGSALLTGLLVGMNMPPVLPLYIPVAASFFAIVVIKWTFGGLGKNWMNPALAGRAFVAFSWPGAMSVWTSPRSLARLDAISSVSPLGETKTLLVEAGPSGISSAELLHSLGNPVTPIATRVTEFFSSIGIQMSPYNVDLFIGNVSGSIGEISAMLLLLGGLYLLGRKVISWEIPIAYLATFGLLIWTFGGTRYGLPLFTGDVWFHLFSGGVMLGAWFMATDMVTSPCTRAGMLIYGMGIGLFTFAIRIYGSLPEGSSLAILLMNTTVPLIDMYVRPRRFGDRGSLGKKFIKKSTPAGGNES